MGGLQEWGNEFTDEMAKWKNWTKENKHVENQLKRSLNKNVLKIVRKKNLLAFKQMLIASGCKEVKTADLLISSEKAPTLCGCSKAPRWQEDPSKFR